MNIYLIFANSDMTEGRGPMVVSRVMLNKDAAINFAFRQPGVMATTSRQIICDKPYRFWYPTNNSYWPDEPMIGRQIVTGDWLVIEIEIDHTKPVELPCGCPSPAKSKYELCPHHRRSCGL